MGATGGQIKGRRGVQTKQHKIRDGHEDTVKKNAMDGDDERGEEDNEEPASYDDDDENFDPHTRKKGGMRIQRTRTITRININIEA